MDWNTFNLNIDSVVPDVVGGLFDVMLNGDGRSHPHWWWIKHCYAVCGGGSSCDGSRIGTVVPVGGRVGGVFVFLPKRARSVLRMT